MARKPKNQKPDIVFDKDGKGLSTQPNQITDLHMAPTLYSERAMDELVWTLQPFYAAAKRQENKPTPGTQLMLNFNDDDAYLVTPDRANKLQREGDFVATIRFRDLPGITPRHYGELRQVLKEMVKTVAEVHTDDGVLTTNLIDIIEEYDTREVIDPLTGEKRVEKMNNLKRNEVKIRIRSEILRNNFFLTDSGYTQFYFPTTRHTKTATANRLYKWLSKWRGIKKDQMEMVSEAQPDGTERTVGRIIFLADYMEVRNVCGLFNSQDGQIINGERVETVAASLAEKDGKEWAELKPAAKEPYMEKAMKKCNEKYAYYSEFAKRYLAQAKKELDDLSAREIADFTFDYRAIFADGRSKGKVPMQVEFTLTIFDLGRELYENKELAAKEKQARDLMKERLALKSEQINIFINRLKPGDHDLLLDKLQRLIDANMKSPRNNVQSWAYSSLANFFDKELPEQRGFTPYEEIKETAAPAPSNLDGQETW
ncbi:MAG: RepB family plasmid replication initiator protein [Prevotellaceae bacterium]|nr:RepB family plasmid replication initiator protein [Prevotellaceae bacterium]